MQEQRVATVKRYTDVERAKCSLNACRTVLLIGSILSGALIIFLAVFLSSRAKNGNKPNTTPQVNDGDFPYYLHAPGKILPVWSHTFESQLNGKPAYVDLLLSTSQASLLNKFVQKHNYSNVLLFAGSVEWNSKEWELGRLPYQSELSQFIGRLSAQTLGALVYINDQKDDFSKIEKLSLFGAALENFNRFAPKPLQSVLLQTEPQDEIQCLFAIQAFLNLKSNVQSAQVWPTCNSLALASTISAETLQLFSQTEAAQILGTEKVQFLEALSKVSDSVVFQLDNADQFKTALAVQRARSLGFKNIVVQFKASTDSNKEAMGDWEDLAAELYKFEAVLGPHSYAELYELLYKEEPRKSQIGWLIDLYRQ